VLNVEEWAAEVEDNLIDFRVSGAIHGEGTLLQKANDVLNGRGRMVRSQAAGPLRSVSIEIHGFVGMFVEQAIAQGESNRASRQSARADSRVSFFIQSRHDDAEGTQFGTDSNEHHAQPMGHDHAVRRALIDVWRDENEFR
jgi:hypothetical protein